MINAISRSGLLRKSINTNTIIIKKNHIYRSMSDLKLPDHALCDFCIIPIGTSSPSVSKHIADVQKLLASSGVKYSMHSAGSTLEGSWDEVMTVVGKAHALLHNNGVVRVQTDIRIGTRTDKVQSMEDKVSVVEKILSEDGNVVKQEKDKQAESGSSSQPFQKKIIRC